MFGRIENINFYCVKYNFYDVIVDAFYCCYELKRRGKEWIEEGTRGINEKKEQGEVKTRGKSCPIEFKRSFSVSSGRILVALVSASVGAFSRISQARPILGITAQ